LTGVGGHIERGVVVVAGLVVRMLGVVEMVG
jgi:hypothetical protein